MTGIKIICEISILLIWLCLYIAEQIRKERKKKASKHTTAKRPLQGELHEQKER